MRRNIPHLTLTQSDVFHFCLIGVLELTESQSTKTLGLVVYFCKISCNSKYIKTEESLNMIFRCFR